MLAEKNPSHVLRFSTLFEDCLESGVKRERSFSVATEEKTARYRVCIWSHGAPPPKKEVWATNSSVRRTEPPARGITSPTLRRAWPKDGPLAAICVQSVDVQCVLQFTLIHAAGCVLHRRTSRVIHRLKLFSRLFFSFLRSQADVPASRGSSSGPDDPTTK